MKKPRSANRNCRKVLVRNILKCGKLEFSLASFDPPLLQILLDWLIIVISNFRIRSRRSKLSMERVPDTMSFSLESSGILKLLLVTFCVMSFLLITSQKLSLFATSDSSLFLEKNTFMPWLLFCTVYSQVCLMIRGYLNYSLFWILH